MQRQIPPGRAFSCTPPTLAPILAALRRNLHPPQVEASSAPRESRWPPPSPAPPGHRRAAGPPVQSARRPLRHLVAYGSTNKYRPVSRSKASGNSCQEAQPVGVLPLYHGDAVEDDGHRKGNGQPAVGLPNPFVPIQCTSSRLLSRLRRPVGRLNAELLGVLGVQSLPAAELHGLGTNDAADRLPREAAPEHRNRCASPAAPIEMKRRSMLCHSVRRVPPPKASSSHRISLYSSTLGASARVTVVSEAAWALPPR